MMSNNETKNFALINIVCNIPVVGNTVCIIRVIMVNKSNFLFNAAQIMDGWLGVGKKKDSKNYQECANDMIRKIGESCIVT